MESLLPITQSQPDMLGLSTLRALELLYNQLSGILEEHQKQEMRRVWKLSWRRCFLHHSNLGSTFHWPGAGLMLLASVLLFSCYGGQPYGSEGVELVSGAALLFLLLCNLYMMHRQGQLKRQEIPRRLQGILKELDAIIHKSVQSAIPLWSSTAYPELLLPHSQAIGLQWAFRDGRLINLPATLLVEGDIISLRPGQQAPASLRGMKEDEHLLLAPGDLYFQSTPLSSPLHRDRSLPQSPHTPGNFRVTQTPVIEDVRRCLNEGTSRPVSVLNNECYALRTLLHKYVVPVTLAILLLTNILRFIFHAPGIGPWKYTLIQLQVNGVLPLLPLLFPVLWVLLNAFGEAKVLVQFSETPPVVLVCFATLHLMRALIYVLTLIADSPCSLSFAKLSQDTISSFTEVISSKDMWLYEWRNVLAILAGRSPALCCTASLLHHLGSVTVLCCVDKQGILSWPNPSPEKVAFFSSRVGPETDYPPEHASFGSADGSEEDRENELCFITETASRPLEEDEQKCNVEGQRLSVRPSPRRWNVCCKPTSMAVVSFSKGVDGGKEDVEIGSEANVEDSKEEEETEEEKDDSQRYKVPPPVIISEDPDNETEDFVCDYRFETLSLSQDQQNPAAVQFDDSRWPLHAASLKPLGLNVLLSACSGSLAERTLRLCDHLASEALEGRASTACLPPQPLCGLCDLPKLIGFMPSARDVFTIESYVALYQPPTLSRGRDVGQDIVRRLPAAVKHRLPLPHLLSLLVRDMNSGALQLLSHGTADLILEGSTDLWDGSDIYPLSPSDRKKVLDFYQRACLSGHCTAFSYKPMSRTLSRHLNGHCIELQVENDVSSGPGLPSSHEGGVSIKLGTRKNSWSSDEGIAEIQDRADCVQALSGQIFMGLVSTQYQAQIDIVRLIDRLDNACIRFVYFSLEDELRSKVFAEKMGLESGWNCHISLQSSGYEAGIDGPHGTSQAGSLHENTHQDGETQQLLEEETHSDVVSYPPTDSDAPSIVECSNRAKLPRGIENIRPHLANIDNVPLLVPLFTDCTPDKICEMVQIMQEYGEVVCCLGSSANEKNSHVFLQSNVSLALDPLYPSRCTWDGFSYGRSANTTAAATATAVEVMENEVLDPLHISTLLNSLPCSISFQNEKNMSLIKLVKQARHMTNSMRKCSLFLLQCQLCIMLVQVLACFLQLPPPLSTTDILWLSCFAHPLISISLLGNCPDDAVMTVATGKNLQFLPNKTVQYFVLCFFGKFFLSICTILSCFVLTLQSSCVTATAMHNGTQCRSILFSEVDGLRWFEDLSNGLLLAQKLTAAFLLLGHLCISVSQVHRSKPLWSKTPFSNIWWAATIPTLLLFQALQTVISLSLWRNADGRLDLTASVVPMTVWLLGFLSLVPLLIVNELVKLHEIRMRERSQKRQKLQFETKLGMNSPF